MTINMTGINTALLVPAVASGIIINQLADLTPLAAMLMAKGPVLTDAETFTWATNARNARRTQINNGGAAYTNATTTLVVDASARFYPGCLILCEATQEIMRVTSITDATTIVVVRGVGGTAHANSVADDAYLRNIGNARGENATAAAAITQNEAVVSNTVQTISTVVEISGRADRVKTFAGDRETEQIAIQFGTHMEDIEHNLLFGARNAGFTDADGRRTTMTAGLRRIITTNVDAIGGTMTRARLVQFMQMACARKREGLAAFAGATAMAAINDIYAGALRVSTSERLVGLKITELQTPFGTVKLMNHSLLTGAYAGDILVFDPDSLKLRYTSGKRDGRPNLLSDQAVAGQDGKVSLWFSEVGLEYGGEFQHALATGVTGAA